MTTVLPAPDAAAGPPGPGTPAPRAHHRADIQGLRAVAVALVVAYHARLHVPGGFVGVDVFFVISGFVITAMLRRERVAEGRTSFRRFYRRRFQRLTPALAATVVVTMVATLALLSPLGAQQNAEKTGLGAMLLSANGVIAKITGGYTDLPARSNPLLNTWSLSVEEQLYLVMPLLLVGAWYLARRRGWRWAPAAMLGAVTVGSFGIAVVASSSGRSVPWFVEFYGPFARAWEFAAGALLALVLARLRPGPRRWATPAGIAGAALIAVAAVAFSDTVTWPGVLTLIPVVGTVLVLAAGIDARHPVGRALSTRPFTAVGDRSYSVYLWHWPFVVFAAVVWPADDAVLTAAVVASLVPALVSYRWLEQPVRQMRHPRRALRIVVVSVVVALGAAGGSWWISDHVLRPHYSTGAGGTGYRGAVGWDNFPKGFTDEFPCADPAIVAVTRPDDNYGPRCHQTLPGADVAMVVMGDSHAEHLFPGLRHALPGANVMVFYGGVAPTPDDPNYAPVYDFVRSTPSVRVVLVQNYWRLQTYDEAQMGSVLRSLQGAGRTVVTTDDVPDFPDDPFRCKFSTPLLGRRCSIDAAAAAAEAAVVTRRLRAVVAASPGVVVLPTRDTFCGPSGCSMATGHTVWFRDDSHLNVRGSRRLVTRMVQDHPEVFGQFAQFGQLEPSTPTTRSSG